MSWLLFALAAGAGALLVGMIGFGSSLVILPVLLLVFPNSFEPDVAVRLAVGTTMATMIVGAVSASTVHARDGTICWPLLRVLIVPYLFGAGFGPWLSRYLPVDVLSTYIVVILVFVGLQTLSARQVPSSERDWRSARLQISLVHFVIGLMSSVAGIASGIFAIPYLGRFNLPLRKIIATSTVAAALYSTFATLGYIVTGANVDTLPDWSLGYVYLPAFAVMSLAGAVFGALGVRVATVISDQMLRRILAAFLIVAAVVITIR